MALVKRRSRSRSFPAAFLFFLATACTVSAAPGWRCSPPELSCKAVYVVHDSWHAAIVLRVEEIPREKIPELADFPDVKWVEFSWGDRDFFPDPNAGVFAALRAAFWSGGSVLHVVGFDRELKAAYPGASIAEIGLTGPSFDRLVNFISGTFLRSGAQGRAPASPGLFAHSRFYPSTHRFSLLKTCNTWVAEALQAAGLPVVPGQVITSGNLAAQIAGLGRTL